MSCNGLNLCGSGRRKGREWSCNIKCADFLD